MVEYVVAIDVTRVRFPADAFWQKNFGLYGEKMQARLTVYAKPGAHTEKNEPRAIRTPNRLIWSQTRYRCAMDPCCNAHSRERIPCVILLTAGASQNGPVGD